VKHKDYDLEERCVEPGHWVIEGFTVREIQKGRWRATTPTGAIVATQTTLNGIRHEIAMELTK
jgi:hypothetical protein